MPKNTSGPTEPTGTIKKPARKKKTKHIKLPTVGSKTKLQIGSKRLRSQLRFRKLT